MMRKVVIIGAGPSGSVAAYESARAGIKPLVLCRENYAGEHAACGGALGVFLLRELAIPEELVERSISGVSIEYEGTVKKTRLKKPLFAAVRREKLDNFLADKAGKAGAKILYHHKAVEIDPFLKRIKVENRQSGEKIYFSYDMLITAAGPTDIAYEALEIGFNTDMHHAQGLAWEIEGMPPADAPLAFIYDHKLNPHGYFWIFPNKDRYNVGIGGFGFERRNSLHLLLREFIESRDFLKNCRIIRKSGGRIPLKTADSFGSGPVICAGDAAGFVNPVTGGGLYYAFWSGKKAAESVVQIDRNNMSPQFLASVYRKKVIYSKENLMLRLTQFLEERDLQLIIKGDPTYWSRWFLKFSTSLLSLPMQWKL